MLKAFDEELVFDEQEDIAKGRKPFKKANRPFVPLDENNYLFNCKDSHCEFPIVNRVKMMRELLDKLENCSPDNKEKYNKILEQYAQIHQDFIYKFF